MELRELEAFIAVVDQGGFRKAAQKLCLTQPAVTRQVAALERELGTRLLDRMGKGAQPTISGFALHRYAFDILRLMDEAKRVIGDVQGGLAGSLTLGASSTAATYLLPEQLRDYRAAYPSVEVRVQTGVSSRVLERVLRNEADAGLVMDFEGHPDIVAHELRRYGMALVTAADSKAAEWFRNGESVWESLEGAEFVCMEPGTNLRSGMERILHEAGIEMEVSVEVDNVEAIKRMVMAGLGVSILPEFAIEEEVRAGRLAAYSLRESAFGWRPLCAIVRRDKYIFGGLLFFLEMLKWRLSQKTPTG